MLLVREIMYCKPGKVRPLVEKFLAMSKLMEKHKTTQLPVVDPGGRLVGALNIHDLFRAKVL